jgi:hypothetical protein
MTNGSQRSIKTILVGILVAVLVMPQTAYPQTPPVPTHEEIITKATATMNKFIDLPIDHLLDGAINSGSNALAQRLDQLNGIIQSAIFNLNQILRERAQDVDEKLRIQRMEAVRELDRLEANVDSVLKTSIEQLDTVLTQNITDFQNALANSFASLPIPTEPLVNLGRQNALTIIANASGPTRLFITGSGLYKNGKQPEAFVHSGAADKNGTRIPVESASMGLITLALPKSLIPDSTSARTYFLSLGLSKGGLFNTEVWPSYPLVICGALPKYTVTATLTAKSGAFWEKIETGRQFFYTDIDHPPYHYEVTAAQFVGANWTVDTDRPGFNNGLQVDSQGGTGEHAEQWDAGKTLFQVWVGTHGSNNSHVWAKAALKRITPIPQCGTTQATKVLDYVEPNPIPLSTTIAYGSCELPLKTPELAAAIQISRAGRPDVPVNLPVPSLDVRALDGQMTLSIDDQGLLIIVLRPSCKQKVTYTVK